MNESGGWSSPHQDRTQQGGATGPEQDGRFPPRESGIDPPPGVAPYGPHPYPAHSQGSDPYGPSPYGQTSYGPNPEENLPPQAANPQNPYLPVGYGYGYLAPPPKHSGSVTAMWLSLGSLTSFVCVVPILLAPAGWIVGTRARRVIDAAPEQWSGRTEATVGIIVGMVMTILLLVGVIAVVGLLVYTSQSGRIG